MESVIARADESAADEERMDDRIPSSRAIKRDSRTLLAVTSGGEAKNHRSMATRRMSRVESVGATVWPDARLAPTIVGTSQIPRNRRVIRSARAERPQSQKLRGSVTRTIWSRLGRFPEVRLCAVPLATNRIAADNVAPDGFDRRTRARRRWR